MNIAKLIVALMLVLATFGTAQAEVDVYIDDLNIYASQKYDNFRSELSLRYGISRVRFDKLLGQVDSPGDLAVSLWIGFKSGEPYDDVIKQYRLRRGQGWGVIAKEIGIKPGSPAFKSLKKGEIGWFPKDFDEVMKERKKKNKSGDPEVEVVETEKERKKREARERKEKKRQEREKKK